MNRPRIYVDFNEMVNAREVLLSKEDSKSDSDGNPVHFSEGLRVFVYMDDYDEHRRRDDLIAEGTAHRNHHGGWTSAAKWVLQIDERGVRHESADQGS